MGKGHGLILGWVAMSAAWVGCYRVDHEEAAKQPALMLADPPPRPVPRFVFDEPRPIGGPARAPAAQGPRGGDPHQEGGDDGACSGSGSKLSVMALDVGDCRVTIGKQSLGNAPMFMKASPVGRCPIEVRCPDGKHFTTLRVLRPGDEAKVIIKPDDWQ